MQRSRHGLVSAWELNFLCALLSTADLGERGWILGQPLDSRDTTAHTEPASEPASTKPCRELKVRCWRSWALLHHPPAFLPITVKHEATATIISPVADIKGFLGSLTSQVCNSV